MHLKVGELMINISDNYYRLISYLDDVNNAKENIAKIRREISDAENFFKLINAHWNETFCDTEILTEDFNLIRYANNSEEKDNNFNKLENKYSKGHIDDSLRKYLPLRTFSFNNDKGLCNVYTIKWNNIATNKSIRNIEFKNNGIITMKKRGRDTDSSLYYDMFYGLYNYEVDAKNKGYKVNYYKDNKYIIKKYNNLVIKHNIFNHDKILCFNSYINNNKIDYKFYFDKNNELTKVRCNMDTYGAKNKIISSYRVEIGKDYIKPFYYSKKGIKTDLRDSKEYTNKLMKIIYLDFYDTLYKESDNDYIKEIKTEYLPVILRSCTNIEPFYSYNMSQNTKNTLTKIDSTIKGYLGEIPFNDLETTMKKDMKQSSKSYTDNYGYKIFKKKYNN